MFCTKCGLCLPDRARFCTRCGAAVCLPPRQPVYWQSGQQPSAAPVPETAEPSEAEPFESMDHY